MNIILKFLILNINLLLFYSIAAQDALRGSDNFKEEDYPVFKNIDELTQFLFPALYLGNQSYSEAQHRQLQIEKAPYTTPVPCTRCVGLSTCAALNNFQIEEVYYPNNLQYLETCKVIEKAASSMEKVIFGNGRTFRDTPQCRLVVMQYLCLFYGSNNPMYKNYCIYQEDVTSPNPDDHKIAPRPPCKSFCVQVSSVCANDPDFYIQTCNRIACPPTQDSCTPDPTLEQSSLAANLGCSVPYFRNPYFRTGSASKTKYCLKLVLTTVLLALFYNLYI